MCPRCAGRLVVDDANVGDPDVDIVEGELRCSSCHDTYAIHSGIARFPMAAGTTASDAVRRTRHTYDFTWTRFGSDEIENEWEKDSYAYTELIPASVFGGSGKTGLDAGCGGGADIRKLWQRGVRVIGFDLSEGVDAIARTTGIPPNGDLVQGDLHSLPFARDSFDFVYSFGVLHHLPDPGRGFAALAAALKPGAPLVTYLYAGFDDRASGWRAMIGMVKQARRITSYLPPRALHVLCWLLVPFVWLVFALPARVVSMFSPRLATRLPFAHTVRWTVLVSDLFDRFAPPVEHRFNEQQVRALYARVGLERVEVRRYRGWVSWGYKPAGPVRRPGPGEA